MRPVVNQLCGRLQISYILILVLLLVGAVAVGLILLNRRLAASSAPEQVVRQYVAGLYARDFERAYQLISTADKAYKSQAEYLEENNSLTGFALEASRQLASYIEYQAWEVERQGERVTVTAHFVVPDGNTPAVQKILSQGDTLTQAERAALLDELDRLYRSDKIPTFEGEQRFELVQEPEGWRVVEDWAGAVRVHFSGEVRAGLSWEFEPLQEVVLAKPGETLQATYRARNLSDRPVVAKARHIDRPEEYLDFLTIVQCFCFIQQTLQPGEETKLPLVFRVEWDTPAEVKDFYVHYEFYPLEEFPEE